MNPKFTPSEDFTSFSFAHANIFSFLSNHNFLEYIFVIFMHAIITVILLTLIVNYIINYLHALLAMNEKRGEEIQ